MFPYWWLLALQGVWAQEQFVREHPQHWGMGKLRQEAMEGWIGLLKQFQRKHGNMSPGWLLRLFEYVDLYTMGAVMQNQVDFCLIEVNHNCRKNLMWEHGVTEGLLAAKESELPESCIDFLNEIDDIHFNDDIYCDLEDRVNSGVADYDQKFDQLLTSYNNLTEEEKRHQHVDIELLQDDLEQHGRTKRKRKSKSQRLHLMQQKQRLINADT